MQLAKSGRIASPSICSLAANESVRKGLPPEVRRKDGIDPLSLLSLVDTIVTVGLYVVSIRPEAS